MANSPTAETLPDRWPLRLVRWGLMGLAFAIVTGWVVPAWRLREGRRVYDGEGKEADRLAAGVAEWVREGDRDPSRFATGSGLINGQFMFATYQMAGLGFVQHATPETDDEYRQLSEACIERIISEELRAFDTTVWGGEDALASLATGDGHVGYLGYLNLLLSLYRQRWPDTPHAALNDEISAALCRRVEASPIGLITTYPQLTFPVDNTPALASVILHQRLTGTDHRAAIERWETGLRERYIDPTTGLMIHRVNSVTGVPLDKPRGSSTSLASYFLGLVQSPLAADLFAAQQRELEGRFMGFGVAREFARGTHGELGDIDSGPVIFGYGMSPTAFSLGGSRIHGDREWFAAIYANATQNGAPLDRGDTRHFVIGGPPADAILFAMITAPRNGELSP